MCIRDRFSLVQFLGLITELCRFSFAVNSSNISPEEPPEVKIQVDVPPNLAMAFETFIPPPPASYLGFSPVSYTHLDVYKRQI